MVCPDKSAPSENKDKTHLRYTAKVDAWACGVLAFELLVGCPPFGMSTREASVKAILYDNPKLPHWLPPVAADFIQWALTKKPSNRPTVQQLLQHSWILAYSCAPPFVSIHRWNCTCFHLLFGSELFHFERLYGLTYSDGEISSIRADRCVIGSFKVITGT
jgi:serine/threonine protein kinase